MNNTKIDATLELLGFTPNNIVETILITKNRDGSYNPAPIGVINKGKKIEIRPYTSSNTYQNLTKSNRLSINITDDPMLFLKTSFKDELEGIPTVTDWVLEGSDATIIAEKTGMSMFSEPQASFSLNPVAVSINRETPTVFSRGRAEAIEAIIHATRVKVFKATSQEEKVKEL